MYNLLIDRQCIGHKKILFIFLSLFFSLSSPQCDASRQFKNDKTVQDYPQNTHASKKAWNKLKPYFLPYKSETRKKLDKIFKAFRVTQNVDSLERAGFKKSNPRHYTRLVVTTHPDLPGFIFKIYLDTEALYKRKPEDTFWLQRLYWANVIREEIKKRNLGQFFKVPKKWIYPIPEEPSPTKCYLRKNFILLAEDMNVYNGMENIQEWKTNPIVTKDLLMHLHNFLKDLGLWDCSEPDNIPFSKDGKIAFVDTQTAYKWPVKFYPLGQALAPDLKTFWDSLE